MEPRYHRDRESRWRSAPEPLPDLKRPTATHVRVSVALYLLLPLDSVLERKRVSYPWLDIHHCHLILVLNPTGSRTQLNFGGV